jgi:hypothetical protein
MLRLSRSSALTVCCCCWAALLLLLDSNTAACAHGGNEWTATAHEGSLRTDLGMHW